MVDIDPIGHLRRYRSAHGSEADAGLEAWEGGGHPSGPWIECKAASGDFPNPEFGREFMGESA